MRKRLITPSPQNAPPLDEGWLDLGGAAVVEVTSEEKEYPVESALVSGEKRGLACRRFWHSDHPAKDFWSPNSLPVPSQQITMFLAARPTLGGIQLPQTGCGREHSGSDVARSLDEDCDSSHSSTAFGLSFLSSRATWGRFALVSALP